MNGNYTYIHTYIYRYIHIRTCIRPHIHTYTHIYIHVHIYTHIHTHTHTHIHTYVTIYSNILRNVQARKVSTGAITTIDHYDSNNYRLIEILMLYWTRSEQSGYVLADIVYWHRNESLDRKFTNCKSSSLWSHYAQDIAERERDVISPQKFLFFSNLLNSSFNDNLLTFVHLYTSPIEITEGTSQRITVL